MSKLLSSEQRVAALRRDTGKDKPAPSDPEPAFTLRFKKLAPVSAALDAEPAHAAEVVVETDAPLAEAVAAPAPEAPVTPAPEFSFSAPAAAPPAPAAPPLNRVPLPTMSPDALRYARRWYSTVSLFILGGVIWGLATILRTDERSNIQAVHPRPAHIIPARIIIGPPAAPEASETPAAPIAHAPAPAHPATRTRAVRDPFSSALKPSEPDAALNEAQRVYSLMETALRNAATTIPESHGTSPAQGHRRGE